MIDISYIKHYIVYGHLGMACVVFLVMTIDIGDCGNVEKFMEKTERTCAQLYRVSLCVGCDVIDLLVRGTNASVKTPIQHY